MRSGDLTREKIKRTAEVLFAERGFNAVSIRDIVEAAEQRNTGSLHYYFRTKEALARELVAEGVNRIDEDRNRRLDQMEASGGPQDLRDIVELLARPYVVDKDFMRFLSRLMQDNYELFLEGAKGQDAGFARIVSHVHHLLPEIPAGVLLQRFQLLIVYLTSMIALKNNANGDESWARFWSAPGADDLLLDTVEGMLRQPPKMQGRGATVRQRRVGRSE